MTAYERGVFAAYAEARMNPDEKSPEAIRERAEMLSRYSTWSPHLRGEKGRQDFENAYCETWRVFKKVYAPSEE